VDRRKELLLATSLSVLLPVHNAQARLVPLVSQLLEVLPDLTPRWDILVIDDASTDATSEVAHDLARHYPQVHLLSLPRTLGDDGVFRVALMHVAGDVVLARREGSRIDLRDIHKLWRRIGTHDVIVGRAASAAPLGWLPRLPSAKLSAGTAEAGLQLIRRRVLEGWRTAMDENQDLDAYLVDKRFTRCDVEMREEVGGPGWEAGSRIRDHAAPTPARRSARATHSDQTPAKRNAAKRPNYLARIKDFALGE
jgi:glycosyltransferase involved in cell wall biosynthesis